jgi:hypothetical protein
MTSCSAAWLCLEELHVAYLEQVDQRVGGLKRKNIGGSRTAMLRRRAFQVCVITLPPDLLGALSGTE